MKECILNFIKRPWSNEEKFFVVLSSALIGIILGVFFSPTGGFHVFSNNGSNNGNNNGNLPNGEENTEDKTTDDDCLSFN